MISEMKFELPGVLLALPLMLVSLVRAETAKPNIIFIMADDLGPGCVDLDGSSAEINTPNPALPNKLLPAGPIAH